MAKKISRRSRPNRLRVAKHPSERQEEQVFSQRRRKLLHTIGDGAALILARPPALESRDTHYPYHPNSNFLYLTGFDEPNAALLLLGKSRAARTILYVRDRDHDRERWEGERLGLRRAKRQFHVDEVRSIESLLSDLPKQLHNVSALHLEPGVDTSIDNFVWSQFASPLSPRMQFPQRIFDVRTSLAEMRFVKDRAEIAKLRHAADITAASFRALAPRLSELKSEIEAARLLESFFARWGAKRAAFETIVASGKHATCLHHRPLHSPLWKRELVLVDAGASYRGYAGDVTRVFPVSGTFSSAQKHVYEVVLAALETALQKTRASATIEHIHDAAARTITKGLVELRVLRGNASDHFERGSYKKFFMHGIGHLLGLDVHDIAPIVGPHGEPLTSPKLRLLVPGVALTLEPGLYFDANDESVPKALRGIGIRIEEDVIVGDEEPEVLSKNIPRSVADIEDLMKL